MSDYITKIRTIDGEKQIDYNALANLPDLNQKADITHEHTAEEIAALPINGGMMTGTLTTNGIVLTQGIDYGSGDPVGGTLGQLYFKKVT